MDQHSDTGLAELTRSGDTIFALSSGALPAGVAIIRISGPRAADGLKALCGRIPPGRKTSLMDIKGPRGDVLDRGLVIFFEGPGSFTGEDSAELQVHGGRAVVSAILDALGHIEGFRHATAGEFSRRAFENGKLDLVEVEGLADLIQAETEMQRKLARHLSEGHLSRRYTEWMERLSRARALIEAELDFADEGDVPGSVSDRVWAEMSRLSQEMRLAMDDRSGEIVREGFRIAIAGKPNAGKSSLLNYLAKRDIAIVTDVAGTTRDVLTVELDVDGLKVNLFDTAGIREATDAVERIGIERALHAIQVADLVLYLTEGGEDISSALAALGSGDKPALVIATKVDQGNSFHGNCDIRVSTKDGTGIDSLLKRIAEIGGNAVNHGQFDFPIMSRHRNNIVLSLAAVDEALAGTDTPLELRAESLRLAGEHLGRITGAVSADDLLGMIFSEFCIGK